MAAMAALQSSMATLSLSSSNSFFGQRLSLPSLSFPQVKSPEKPCLIVVKLKRWERKECKENSLPVLHKMHVKVGDTIQVIAGDDKGKIGEITKIFRHNSTVVVKEINLKTKHVKSREEGEPGQIIKIEAPIHSSNVMLYSKEKNIASRVGHKLQFSYGWYFTFVQSFVYVFLIYLQGFTPKQMVNPWKTYVKLSAVLMGSHGLTKGSLAFLNYPAQIMFKSTKVLPVMVMGAFIPGLRRKYPAHEYASALLLVAGLIIFTLADAKTSPNFSIIGVLMISGALIMDAFLGNLQEAIFTLSPETTQMEMLFCSSVVGLPFLIPPMVLTGELFKAWNSCSQHPYVYVVLVFEAMATFIGQVSVLSLIALFGAATTAMVTTARKAVTLLLSYLIFTKPLTEQHGTGLLLIAMGITLKLLPEKNPYKRSSSSTTKKDKIEKASTNDEEERVFQLEIEAAEDEEKRPLV